MAEENVTVSCPYCGMQYEIPSEYLGQEAECSGCSKQFVLALPESGQTSDSVPPEEQTVVAVCASCGTRYDVPSSMIGGSAECSQCGATFTITAASAPAAEPTPSEEKPAPAAETVQGESTNTVKLSRKSVGMIPTVKDDPFKVAVVATHTNIGIPPESVPEAPPPPPPKKWWQFWKK